MTFQKSSGLFTSFIVLLGTQWSYGIMGTLRLIQEMLKPGKE